MGQKINRLPFSNLSMSKYMGCDIYQAGSVGNVNLKTIELSAFELYGESTSNADYVVSLHIFIQRG